MYTENVMMIGFQEILAIGKVTDIHMILPNTKPVLESNPVFLGFYETVKGEKKEVDKEIVFERVMNHLSVHRLIPDDQWKAEWVPLVEWDIGRNSEISPVCSVQIKLYKYECLDLRMLSH